MHSIIAGIANSFADNLIAEQRYRMILNGLQVTLLIDEVTPHLHPGDATPEGPRSKLSRTAMLALAVTIHNLPEGMAVGVVLAGATQGTHSNLSTIGFAIGFVLMMVLDVVLG